MKRIMGLKGVLDRDDREDRDVKGLDRGIDIFFFFFFLS